MTASIETPPPGIYPATPFETYHAWPAWGSSDLKAMRAGPPAMVPFNRSRPHEHTDATRLGTAAHCAIIEPHLFHATFEHKPEDIKFSTLQGKTWRDDPIRAGKILVPHDQWEAIERIVASFQAKSIALLSLETSLQREASIVWNDGKTGETLKGRPDWYDDDCVTDLKVSVHAGAGEWIAARVHAMGWMSQIAHYRAGLRALGVPIRTGRIVLVQPTEPHLVFTLEVKESALDLLDYENEETVQQLKACRESGVWPGPPDQWTKIDLPPKVLTDGILLGATEEDP